MDAVFGIWQTATPLVLAALAGALSQRAGIWHLGLGGLISIGAMLSVVLSKETGSVPLGVGVAVLGSVLISLVMWFVIDRLHANAIIVGIGVNALGLGGTILGLVAIYGAEGTVTSPLGLAKVAPGATGQLAQLSIVAAVTPLIVIAVWLLVTRTRLGLQMAATGDHPFAARSAGISTGRMRLLALVLGGVLCGLAGTELALGSLNAFSPNMEGGRGLIAFAAVILGAARPLWTTAAAVMFGAVNYLGIWAQINLQEVPAPLMLMLPYLAVVVAVVIAARVGGRGSSLPQLELRT